MPESAKIESHIDKNPEIQDMQSYQEDDENAKSATEFGRGSNNGSDDFLPMCYENDEFNSHDVFFENFHAGYKREAEHR